MRLIRKWNKIENKDDKISGNRDWGWDHVTGHMTMILQLPSFLDASSVERAKCVRRIAVYILMKKPSILVEDWERKTR